MAFTVMETRWNMNALKNRKRYAEAYAAYREASSAYPHNGLLDLELGWTVWFDVLGKDGQFSLSRIKLVIRALDILAETVPDCEETANQLMHIREMLFSGTLSKLSKENKQAFVAQVFSNLSVIYACASTEAITKWYMVIGRSLSEVSLAMCPAFADSARKYFTILPSNAVYYLLYRKAKAEFQEKKYEQAIESCREALSYEGEQESIVHFLIVKSALGLSHSTKDREVKQQAHELARLHAILYQRKPAKSADFIFYFEYGKVFAFFLMRREHFLCREYAVRIAKTKKTENAEWWLKHIEPVTSPYAEGIDAMTDQELENELNMIWANEAEQYHLSVRAA